MTGPGRALPTRLRRIDAGVGLAPPFLYVDAHRMCTQMRGVRETVPMTRVTCGRGSYETDPHLRSEFLTMCGPKE